MAGRHQGDEAIKTGRLLRKVAKRRIRQNIKSELHNQSYNEKGEYIPKSQRRSEAPLPTQFVIIGREGRNHAIDRIEEMDPVKNQLHVKPLGGLWTSTYQPTGKFASGWIEWCYSEEPEWITEHAFLLEVKPDARIYTIDSQSDVLQLLNKYKLYRLRSESGKLIDVMDLGMSMAILDWEKIAQDYDGVHLTEEGQWRTRLARPGLYGWDCESTIWFRNVFSRITLYKGKLVRE